MKKLFLVLLTSTFLTVLGCSQSDSGSTAEMSDTPDDTVADTSYTGALKATMQIVKGMNHRPSAVEKSALTTYIGAMDSSVNGMALAETMAIVKGIEHFPSDADKATLEKLIGDLRANSGDADLLALMEIVGRVAHKVSGEDSAKLEAMIAP